MIRNPLVSQLLTRMHVLRRFWWRIRRPHTYGVKVLLFHPEDSSKCLLVRHSYVDKSVWALPGGRYWPHRESPQAAGMREVREELGIECAAPLSTIGTAESVLEGKQDSITILSGTAAAAGVTLSSELAEARWTRTDLVDLPLGARTSKWLALALDSR